MLGLTDLCIMLHICVQGFDETFLDVTDLVDKELEIHGRVRDNSPEFVGHLYESSSTTRGRSCQCGCVLRMSVGSILAQRMRQAVYDQLGFTSCAGVSTNKLLAKLAGEIHKPNDQTTLLPVSKDSLDVI